MKAWFPLIALTALTGAAAPPLPAAAPVVIELFTSQGCSSCPPADSLMADFAHDPAVLVMLRPVTYWDRLGWKDTLARPENTALQEAYARRGIPGAGVYTPQAVVEGAGAAIGSRAREIRVLVAGSAPRAALAARVAPGGNFGIGIAGAADKPAELMLVALRSAVRVVIGLGENSGRSITYTNVVRAERRIGGWTGGRQSLPLPRAWLNTAGADRYAVVLREPGGGRILAAQRLPL